ncbi:acyltransferase [Euzebyella marina]|uniref:Acyltransferase n=1 Tax=Euzebyella marina TaxID=1761453 RepID=A0A3G2L102_9FLAO|nr:acyltransferase [Euzebyella marina]AYN65886.1 acyltransferase [Euzebyella marina]AYN69532.1 acyltransferase [Euzebyella marina]
MFLNSLNTYRGIAILLIVSAHCYSIADVKVDSFSEALFANLTAGSTFHFIFISGFLFHHIFVLKDRTTTFLPNKIKRLLIPYTVLSIVPILLKLSTEPDFWNTYFPLQEDTFLNNYVIPICLYYVTGAHLVAYWYIPFAMCLFLMYPLHIRFINWPIKLQFSVFGILFLIALFVHRPVDELNVFQSLVYFTPTYLMGILCSLYKERVYYIFLKKELYLLLLALGIAAFQAFIGRYDNYQKPMFDYDGLDLVLLQKTFLCIFFMVFLHRFESFNNKLLVLLASTSFAIYFIHGYVLQGLFQFKRIFNYTSDYPWATYFLAWFLLVGVSMALAIILKKAMPKYSKYISGY